MSLDCNQRVAVYGPGWCTTTKKFREPSEGRWVGTIIAFDHGYVIVEPEWLRPPLRVYPKQCYKLKAKKKRKRLWVESDWLRTRSCTPGLLEYPPSHGGKWVEFIEVKRG